MKNHAHPQKLLVKCLVASRALSLQLSSTITYSSSIGSCFGLRQARATHQQQSLLMSTITAYSYTSRSSSTETTLFSKLKYKSVEDTDYCEDFELMGKTPPQTAANTTRTKHGSGTVIVTNVQELREAVLHKGVKLSDVDLQIDYSLPPLSTGALNETEAPFQHEVLRLMLKRYQSKSKPNCRHPDDKTSKLALAIEGGGMRGAVSAGMAAALASLGLTDTVDVVYGSSAGCVIAAYLLSGQMCIDIYTELLPDAKSQFVCKKRLMTGVFITAVQHLKQTTIGALQQPRRLQLPILNGKEEAASEYHSSRLMVASMGGGNTSTSTSATILNYWNKTSVSTSPSSTATNTTARKKVDANASAIITRTPGMNISFILDEIMCPQRGMRPFDMTKFNQHHKMQPLRVVSSAVKTSNSQMEMATIAFGSQDEDFFPRHDHHNENDALLTACCSSTSDDDSDNHSFKIKAKRQKRSGLFACLEASMTVPGAAGPPRIIMRRRAKATSNKNTKINEGVKEDDEDSFACFDSFVFEPMPYRSAVEEGATHVLVFRSRPEGCKLETKPRLYEKIVAPLYFHSHGLPTVGNYFRNGGQQYRYVEDVLTLQEGHKAGMMAKRTNDDKNDAGKIPVPPTKVLYGIDGMEPTNDDVDTTQWKRAHLFPIITPRESSELQTLEQGKTNVVEAVRNGYAAAFDILAPLVGITLDSTMNGKQVAEILFPNDNTKTQQNNKLIDLLLSTLSNYDEDASTSGQYEITNIDKRDSQRDKVPLRGDSGNTSTHECFEKNIQKDSEFLRGRHNAGVLLSFLPGMHSGKLSGLVEVATTSIV